MKIEVGKYYKRRDGKLGGVAETADGAYPVRCGSNYYGEDGYYYNSDNKTEMDLVEECNADGSPTEANRCLQVGIGDRLRREEIALTVLAAMIASPPVCNRDEVDKPKWCRIAFEWADVFLKAANQS